MVRRGEGIMRQVHVWQCERRIHCLLVQLSSWKLLLMLSEEMNEKEANHEPNWKSCWRESSELLGVFALWSVFKESPRPRRRMESWLSFLCSTSKLVRRRQEVKERKRTVESFLIFSESISVAVVELFHFIELLHGMRMGIRKRWLNCTPHNLWSKRCVSLWVLFRSSASVDFSVGTSSGPASSERA